MGKNINLDGMGKIISSIMHENTQILYDIASKEGEEKKFFMKLKNSDLSVRVADERDPEQMYLKGIFDGMDLFYCFIRIAAEEKGNGNE